MVGLHSRLAHGGDAQREAALNSNHPPGSDFGALRHMRGPSLAGFRLNRGETSARWRMGNPDEDIAGRALDLTTSMAGDALQRLVAAETVEFEFGGVHRLHSFHGPTGCKNNAKHIHTFSPKNTHVELNERNQANHGIT